MSKLVDICRQSIVIESVQALIHCLTTICEDNDVSIIRIKNRLDPAYDSAISAGYRDVCINLRFSNNLTKAFGLELHVCEIQLILLPYAKLKVEVTVK